MNLADLGAEVIKIEDPTTGGDVARYVPPATSDADSLYFQSFNRGKKSIAIDLRKPEGVNIFHQLVEKSDAVFNNLRGDLPKKLGLTYETLRSLNPSIVTCSLSGFGRTGPRASEPGYDPIMQAMAGYMSITGEPDGPPGKAGVSIIDFAGGYAAALGLVAALLEANTTGVGRDVDVSLLDSIAVAAAEPALPVPPLTLTLWALAPSVSTRFTLRFSSVPAATLSPPPSLIALRTIVLTC